MELAMSVPISTFCPMAWSQRDPRPIGTVEHRFKRRAMHNQIVDVRGTSGLPEPDRTFRHPSHVDPVTYRSVKHVPSEIARLFRRPPPIGLADVGRSEKVREA